MPGPGMGDFHRPCNCGMGHNPSPPPQFTSGCGCALPALIAAAGIAAGLIAIVL
ncbi:MAG: hypothetical protein IJZ39_04330 [Oscillospiraceae bacterium]|nr:hypothetical protein [Oscillospiraceae bacterium]